MNLHRNLHRNLQRKNPLRLFSGLAGSPLVRVQKPIPLNILPPSTAILDELSQEILANKKPGRPRQHRDDAARQRACRARKTLSKDAKKKEAEICQILKENYDRKGRIPGESSGGYDTNKIAIVAAAGQRKENGGRVRPKGHGLKAHEEIPDKNQPVETDGQFVNRQSFPLDGWKLDDRDKEIIIHDLASELFLIERRNRETKFDPAVDDVGIQVVVRCPACNMAVNIWPQASEHLREYHVKICRLRIRQMTPKLIFTTEECPETFHGFQKERGDRTCRRCYLSFVTTNKRLKPFNQNEMKFELNVGETSPRHFET
jgi:hypothetical protein